MGPSRRPPTDTFVEFAPAPLRGCDSNDRPGSRSRSAWRDSLLLRIGLLAMVTCVVAVAAGAVAGPLFGLLAVGCIVIEGQRMWVSAHAPPLGALRVVPISSPARETAPPEETATG